jgi:hypothetical protein
MHTDVTVTMKSYSMFHGCDRKGQARFRVYVYVLMHVCIYLFTHKKLANRTNIHIDTQTNMHIVM